MQEYITKDTLLTLGIDLSGHDLDSLISHLNDTVEERIGAEITESLSDTELEELVTLQEAASEQEIGAWVAKHVPDFQQIVQDNIDIVIGELADSADGINDATA